MAEPAVRKPDDDPVKRLQAAVERAGKSQQAAKQAAADAYQTPTAEPAKGR